MITTTLTPVHPCQIRTKNHREVLGEIWESEEWQAQLKEWLKENPVCESCGGVAQVPHHENDVQYRNGGIYLDIKWCIPLCHRCHYALHRGLVLCPVCGKNFMRPGKEQCWHCLTECEREQIRLKRVRANESRNRQNRRRYQQWKRRVKER